MDQFNSQFATRKLRGFDQSEFHPSKVWDFLDTQTFDDRHTSFKRKTAKEIWMMMTPQEKDAYAAYQWDGDTEEIHPKEKSVIRGRALANKVDNLKYMTSLMQEEELDETSATGTGASFSAGEGMAYTGKKKKTDEIIKKVGGKYAVYPEKGGKRLGTHDSKAKAQKQLAAIEISKQQKEAKERGTGKGFIFKDLWEDEQINEGLGVPEMSVGTVGLGGGRKGIYFVTDKGKFVYEPNPLEYEAFELSGGKVRMLLAKSWFPKAKPWEEEPDPMASLGQGKGRYIDEELNENYSRFKKETKTRTNEQQLHAAMRLAEKKIHEANRILEYTSQLRGELNETRMNKNTQKLMERITRGIAEAYGKMKKLK